MKNSTGVLIGFLLGGTLGSVVTYFFVKDKFANQAQAEIEEIREYYSNRKPADICEKPEPPMTKKEIFQHISDYDKKVFDLGYLSQYAGSSSRRRNSERSRSIHRSALRITKEMASWLTTATKW